MGAVSLPATRLEGSLIVAKAFKGNSEKRDGKRFVLLPYVVLESPGYRAASHTARSLLVDIARQYSGHNNGRLVACPKYLEPLGWRSNSTVSRALRELQDCGLLVETRKGARPNKAAWFALTWLDIDPARGIEIDPTLARRGEYMSPERARPATSSRTREATAARRHATQVRQASSENACLTPSHGGLRRGIAPSDGLRTSISSPSDGAIRLSPTPVSLPSDGEYVEVPSVGDAFRGGRESGRPVAAGRGRIAPVHGERDADAIGENLVDDAADAVGLLVARPSASRAIQRPVEALRAGL